MKTPWPASPIKRIVAMPLHKSRLRQRGFNQAHEIAKRIAHSLNINYESRQVKPTASAVVPHHSYYFEFSVRCTQES